MLSFACSETNDILYTHAYTYTHVRTIYVYFIYIYMKYINIPYINIYKNDRKRNNIRDDEHTSERVYGNERTNGRFFIVLPSAIKITTKILNKLICM